MGLFDSSEERARKKKLKAEEKERKRKEFERIMASNPEVSRCTNVKVNPDKELKEQEKIKRNIEIDKSRNIDKNFYTTKSNHDKNVVYCPKCKSTSLTANKKGFSLAKGALGVATIGLYGLVAAGHGKNKVIVTCLKCGHQWKAGE